MTSQTGGRAPPAAAAIGSIAVANSAVVSSPNINNVSVPKAKKVRIKVERLGLVVVRVRRP
jgi:hypothetical protein